jgi:plasmid stabilization system protein ParE
MKVSFTPEAEQQADASDVWWRENRDERELFAQELAATIALLAAEPRIGTVYGVVEGQIVRRLLMPKTRRHVYFTSNRELELVVVHAVWGAPRGREPSL